MNEPNGGSAHPGVIRAVVDTSALVPARMRRRIQQAAQIGAFTALWSPWIIAELNRVLVWRWIKDRTGGDLSMANEHACSRSAKEMMEWLLPSFDVVTPLPPYPPAWASLADKGDEPIWAAAVLGSAQYVISENTRHYPPRRTDGRYVHQDIEYVGGHSFLDMLDENVD